MHVNPTLLLNEAQEGFDIHDETYPLPSFHLAPAYASRSGKSPEPGIQDLYDLAQEQLRRGPWPGPSRNASGVESLSFASSPVIHSNLSHPQ